jgi:phthalate 4,5-cis-dihydrodiol dehydrogenase
MQVGVAGLGAGAVQVIRAMANAPYIQLMAAADVRPEARAAFTSRFQGRTYALVEELCRDPEVEVVWISTPNQFHCEHTIIAANHGKHVVVEKPMALTLEEAQRMTQAAEQNGVQLLCGHTASLMAANQAMRRLITSGEIGDVKAINVWSYTDWMFRPRMPQELDIRTGGGVVYRQGPHQVDTVRLMGGGRVRSVRAMTGQWFPRPGDRGVLCGLPGVRERRAGDHRAQRLWVLLRLRGGTLGGKPPVPGRQCGAAAGHPSGAGRRRPGRATCHGPRLPG